MTYFLTAVGAVIYAEFIGYWLHILLHSEKVPALSRAHMLHHLRDYGPGSPLHRSGHYLSSAQNRSSFLGLGYEWFLPIMGILSFSFALLYLVNVPWVHQAVFTVSGVCWGHFMFGRMHSAMHLKDFWMLKVPVLGSWFRRIRRLHDIHHMHISDDGRMLTNYGISFFWFDRIFGSYNKKSDSFNQKGHKAALVRYKEILKEVPGQPRLN